MTPKQFYDTVVQMRQAQKNYYKTRQREALQQALNLEKIIDDEISRVSQVINSKGEQPIKWDDVDWVMLSSDMFDTLQKCLKNY